MVFRTLSRPGSLSPDAAPAPWSLHLGLPEGAGEFAAVFMANGFVVPLPSPSSLSSAICLVAGPGILVGRSPSAPVLFSAEHEVRRGESGEWVERPDQTVALLTDGRTSDCRFCVVVSGGGHSAALERARAWIERDPDSLLQAEMDRRAAFTRILGAADAARPLVWQALEGLAARLRSASGAFPFRWVAAEGRDDLLDANAACAAAAAWSLIDPEVAEDVLKSALACQLPDGSIPAACAPDAGGPGPCPAWPLFAQATAWVWARRPEAALLDYALPRLHRYLVWALGYYDAEQNGTPCWQNRRESIEPDSFEPRLASADLTALLIREIESFVDLCGASVPPYPADRSALSAHRERLAARLENFFWDPAESMFADRYLDGRRRATRVAPPTLPLLVSGLPSYGREALLKSIRDASRPSGDALASSAAAMTRILLLEAMRRNAESDQLTPFARGEFEAAAKRLRGRSGDTTVSGAEPVSPGEAPALLWPAAPAAAWIVFSAAASGRAGTGRLPGSIEWLDRHRSLVLRSAIALAASAVLAVGLAVLVRQSMPRPSIQALAGLAQRHYVEGDYERAIEIYRDLLPGTRGASMVELFLGNAYLKKGEFVSAEKCYVNVLGKDPSSPPARLNLALALYRQGRKREAAEQYTQFVERYGNQHPDLALRAQTALKLIEDSSGGYAMGR